MSTMIISKSKFLSGIQCDKRLFLEVHHPELFPILDPGLEALFNQGHEVGLLATKMYPKGQMVEWGESGYKGAVQKTKKLLKDTNVRAIFEAAFEVKGLRIKTDILVRKKNNNWDLLEVKSGTSVKDVNLWDIAFQKYVLSKVDLPVSRSYIVHLNREYVHPGGDLILKGLFYKADCTKKLPEYLSQLASKVPALKAIMSSKMIPEIDIGEHCNDPYACPFWDYCTSDKPRHWIQYFYKMSQVKKDELEDRGIHNIRDVPEDEPLSQIQKRIREVLISGKEFYDSHLKRDLGALTESVHYLDFETFNPAIPIYSGTRPYDVIPFQWSLHIENKNGDLEHHAFLSENDEDPRGEFINTLLNAVEPAGGILIYTNYEITILQSLIPIFPDRSKEIKALIDRCVDFCDIIRKNVYHPEFYQSFSLKSVLPALVPEMTYDDLKIQDGMTASQNFLTMLKEKDSFRREGMRQALLDYCKRDTLALVLLRNRLWPFSS